MHCDCYSNLHSFLLSLLWLLFCCNKLQSTFLYCVIKHFIPLFFLSSSWLKCVFWMHFYALKHFETCHTNKMTLTRCIHRGIRASLPVYFVLARVLSNVTSAHPPLNKLVQWVEGDRSSPLLWPPAPRSASHWQCVFFHFWDCVKEKKKVHIQQISFICRLWLQLPSWI